MANTFLLRSLPLLRCRAAASGGGPFRHFADGLSAPDSSSAPVRESTPAPSTGGARPPSRPLAPENSWADHPEYRRWREKEEEILLDIRPITLLIKEIIHSDRYLDGERLSVEDEKEVVKKILPYHPHSEDKIGCGLDYIMVDRHPTFKCSRCLFVVRTDGGWIDFSYQKCLRSYIRQKYPSYAEKFIREHYKRT